MAALQRTYRIICGVLVVGIWPVESSVLRAADKAPVPPADAQKAALALVKDVYGEEYAEAEKPEQKIALAQKLLQTAKKTEQGTANHYALLRVAWDVATQAGDANLAMRITDEMVGVYDVNALSAKVATVKTTGRFSRSSKQRAALAIVALELAEETADGDEYDSANELASIGIAAARKAQDWELVKQFVAHEKEIKEAAEAHAEVQAALATLEKNPTDPAANQAAGEYFCFVKGDWGKGIPMLALGNDEAVRTLAQRDLKGASSPDEQVVVGDGWWELAQMHDGERKEMLLLRAGSWYGEAKTGLSSALTLAKVEKRLEEIEKIGRPAPKAPATAKTVTSPKTPKRRGQIPEGSILLMTFAPETINRKDGKMYVTDLSGNENHGLVEGATLVATGPTGAALQFSGRDSVILPTLGTHLTRELKQLSICLWVMQADIEGNVSIFDVGSYANPNHSISLYRQQGRVRFLLPGRLQDRCAHRIEAKQWHHVACVWNGTEQGMYVNAWLKAKTPTHDLILNTTSLSNEPARLGTQAKSGREQWYFRGLIDEVAIFNRALSEQEIRSLYQMGLQGQTLAQPDRTR